MKLSQEFLLGAAVGAVLVLALNQNKTSNGGGPTATVPPIKVLPPAVPVPRMAGRKYRAIGNYITQPGYPMPGWYA